MARRTFKDAEKVKKTIKEDPEFCQWFVGLVDGEGCFSMLQVKPKLRWIARLTIALREDDREVISLLTEKFGGRVNKTNDKRMTHSPSLHWEFNTPFGCYAIIELFGKWPLKSKKKKDFDIWKEAVELWVRSRRKYPPNINKMISLYKALKESKVFKEDILCMEKS